MSQTAFAVVALVASVTAQQTPIEFAQEAASIGREFQNFNDFRSAFNVMQGYSSTSYPGDSCCHLWDGDDYAASRWTYCLDDPTKAQSWDLNDDNRQNEVASIWCGKNIWYKFCESYESNCYNQNVGRGAGNTKNPYFRPHEAATEIFMYPYDVSNVGAVTLYREPYCSNQQGTFFANEDPTQKIGYTSRDMYYNGQAAGVASSIMVPFGYAVELWDRDSWGGNVVTITGGPYTDSNNGMQCMNLTDYNWDNKTKSLKVYKTRGLGIANGYWDSITATESIDFVVHYGLMKSSSTATSETEEYTMNYELSVGVEYSGVSASTTINQGYANSITKDTQDMYSEDVSYDWTLTCTGQVGADGGVGLWQWITESSDSKTQVLTKHTVCRYGDVYNTAPACPWNACVNGDCTICRDDWSM